jgi:hypothetical protein
MEPEKNTNSDGTPNSPAVLPVPGLHSPIGNGVVD